MDEVVEINDEELIFYITRHLPKTCKLSYGQVEEVIELYYQFLDTKGLLE